MIAERALLLQNGREVRLAVVPVDPRDFFRGDYVMLSYEISQLYSSQLAGDDAFDNGDAIYVTLDNAPDGALPTAISHERPSDGVFILGTVTEVLKQVGCETDCWRYSVVYDIEKIFRPGRHGPRTGKSPQQQENQC